MSPVATGPETPVLAGAAATPTEPADSADRVLEEAEQVLQDWVSTEFQRIVALEWPCSSPWPARPAVHTRSPDRDRRWSRSRGDGGPHRRGGRGPGREAPRRERSPPASTQLRTHLSAEGQAIRS